MTSDIHPCKVAPAEACRRGDVKPGLQRPTEFSGGTGDLLDRKARMAYKIRISCPISRAPRTAEEELGQSESEGEDLLKRNESAGAPSFRVGSLLVSLVLASS